MQESKIPLNLPLNLMVESDIFGGTLSSLWFNQILYKKKKKKINHTHNSNGKISQSMKFHNYLATYFTNNFME